jgi:hypothetical protein
MRSASTAGQVVLKNSTATWQAYNAWGGYDLHNGPGGLADYDNRSLAVSLDRPFDLNGAFLFLAHERPLIQLAERLGVPLAYVTSMEIAAEPRLLDGASAWSSATRPATGRIPCTAGTTPWSRTTTGNWPASSTTG